MSESQEYNEVVLNYAIRSLVTNAEWEEGRVKKLSSIYHRQLMLAIYCLEESHP